MDMLANDLKATTGKEVLCKVCGDRASGKHYGVASCDGCRGFFKRSIRRNLQYVCKEGGKCMIDVMRRNQCQSCRFAKCLLVNMRKEAVQHERAPRSSVSSQHCGLINIPFDFYSQTKPTTPQSTNMFLSIPNMVTSEIIYKPSVDTCYSDTLATSAFPKDYLFTFGRIANDPLSNILTGGTGSIQNFKKPPSKIDESCPREVIFESAAKLLYFAVKWARSIPHYSHLPSRDQSILLEASWAELFVVMAVQYCLPIESVSSSKDLDTIRRVFEQFRNLKVDVSEASCLMALILFRITSSLNSITLEYITLVKDQTIAYLTEKCGSFRLGHLLLLLPLIRTAAVPQYIQDTFFKGTVGEVAIERLLGDLV